MTEACAFGRSDLVVELGAGTGSFTRHLAGRLEHPGRLLALEIGATSLNLLHRRFPDIEIIADSAERLGCYVSSRSAQCVVSGLAWGNMLPATQDRILAAVTEALVPNGQFVAFAYLHARLFPTTLRFRRLLFERFVRVETTSIVWRNLPPAYLYRCWRPR